MALASTAEILADFKAGKMVILIDEEDRENEGDLLLAADFVTPDAINFMARHARGLICLTLTQERCRQLNLPLMTVANGTRTGTNFTLSIEAAEGVTTGISAADRACTVRAAVARDARPSDLVQPGHIFPIMARDGGVLVRAGHTEAGCDLGALTGLTPATSGRATILGQAYRDLHNPGRQVGVMLDASAQHPGRTGREVLRVAAVSVGVSKARVEEALALVGLTDEEAGRRVRNYSLGMRQRLGIAAALLGEPQVLVLDEPANGLDPQGIHWMRGLLRRFADGGGTVLLSSHLLHEVQIVADDLVMIGRGRIVAMGSKEELLSRGGTTVSSTDDVRLAGLLEAADVPVSRTGSGLVVDAEARVVGEIAAREAIVLLELRSGGSEGLEEMFLGLTAATSREGEAA